MSLSIHHQVGNKIFMRDQQLKPLTVFYPLAPMEILILFMAIILLFVINYQTFVKSEQIWVLIILDCGLITGSPVMNAQLRKCIQKNLNTILEMPKKKIKKI